jgi:hypothetical protein
LQRVGHSDTVVRVVTDAVAVGIGLTLTTDALAPATAAGQAHGPGGTGTAAERRLRVLTCRLQGLAGTTAGQIVRRTRLAVRTPPATLRERPLAAGVERLADAGPPDAARYADVVLVGALAVALRRPGLPAFHG